MRDLDLVDTLEEGDVESLSVEFVFDQYIRVGSASDQP